MTQVVSKQLRASCQKIISTYVTVRDKIFSEENDTNVTSKREENYLNLNSVDLDYIEEKKTMKSIIDKLIKKKQLNDPIYEHEDELLVLISCFEHLKAEKDENILNSFIEILYAYYEKFSTNVNSEKIDYLSWEKDLLSVGSFLFGGFQLSNKKNNITNLKKFLSLASVGEEQDYMRESFFYFESNNLWISCVIGSSLLQHEYLVFLKNDTINSEYLSVVQKHGVEKISGDVAIVLNSTKTKKTRNLNKKQILIRESEDSDSDSENENESNSNNSTKSKSNSSKKNSEKGGKIILNEETGYVSESSKSKEGTESSSSSETDTDSDSKEEFDSSDSEDNDTNNRFENSKNDNAIYNGINYIDRNNYNDSAAVFSIALLVIIIIAFNMQK